MKAKAPYNFVPVSDKVYLPDWAEHVAHDLPFEDGESGYIDLTITAESPLFVGGKSNRENTSDALDFPRDAQGNIFIPGTSIKGMTRNVLEILSFGKMKGVSKVKNHVRDFRNKELYKLLDKMRDIRAGWLTADDGGQWKIEPCKLGRIGHDAIDDYLKTELVESYKKEGKVKLNSEKNRTAKAKYALVEEAIHTSSLKFSFSKIEKSGIHPFFEMVSSGGERGTLVLTGQPSHRWFNPRKKNPFTNKLGAKDGKFYEFVFFDKALDNDVIKVYDDKKNDFLQAYYNHDSSNISEDWKMWREKLQKGEKVPVFFRADGKNLKDFGLSFLYKMPYNNAPVDLLSNDHKNKDFDLSEVLFGALSDEKNRSLKGRVQFGHALLKNGKQGEQISVLLAGPRSTYYPFYIKQEVTEEGKVMKGTYAHFDSAKASLSGWKRYPVANTLKKEYRGHVADQKGKGPNEKMLSRLRPLQSGASLKSRVYFHNLRTVEIGALLSALTFHGQANCRHQLGMGKPLGMGKIKLETNLNGCQHDADFYMSVFENEMELWAQDKHLKTWLASEQLHELFAMASINNEGIQPIEEQLQYMALKDFVEVKNAKAGLPRFSRLEGVQTQSLSGFKRPDWQKQYEEQRTVFAANLANYENEKEQHTERADEKANLERQKIEEKEQKKQARINAIEAAEQERRDKLEAAEIERQKEKRAANLVAGVASDIKACKDYKKLQGFFRRFQDTTKGEQLPADAIDALQEKLQVFNGIKRNKKEFESFENPHSVWQKMVIHWVGEEKAKEMYTKLNQ
ncbi:MAG: TIGR03986 family CRISPR-associated RAMP protein [Schleiferiaceae bacterium]|nr:TIGR03986 family CRISPR-associated RAMP protein [Schleiferiaceae bacterium]